VDILVVLDEVVPPLVKILSLLDDNETILDFGNKSRKQQAETLRGSENHGKNI
jgi:hypothetical protein